MCVHCVCVCVCVWLCMHAKMHTCILYIYIWPILKTTHPQIHTCNDAHPCRSTNTVMHTHTVTKTHMHTHTSTNTHTHTSTNIVIYIYVIMPQIRACASTRTSLHHYILFLASPQSNALQFDKLLCRPQISLSAIFAHNGFTMFPELSSVLLQQNGPFASEEQKRCRFHGDSNTWPPWLTLYLQHCRELASVTFSAVQNAAWRHEGGQIKASPSCSLWKERPHTAVFPDSVISAAPCTGLGSDRIGHFSNWCDSCNHNSIR